LRWHGERKSLMSEQKGKKGTNFEERKRNREFFGREGPRKKKRGAEKKKSATNPAVPGRPGRFEDEGKRRSLTRSRVGLRMKGEKAWGNAAKALLIKGDDDVWSLTTMGEEKTGRGEEASMNRAQSPTR